MHFVDIIESEYGEEFREKFTVRKLNSNIFDTNCLDITKNPEPDQKCLIFRPAFSFKF